MMVADVFLIKSSHNVRYLAFLFEGLELLLYLCIRNMQRYIVAKNVSYECIHRIFQKHTGV